MAVIAGKPGNIGLGNDILGIAPLAGDCSPQDNVISFSFANHHGNNERVNNLCWTAAQETAHALGLDHEYMFSDGQSACNDPMTYRFDCGGQKFFRNKAASCGENEVRQCRCGGSQNSHLKIKAVFGEGTSLIPAPTLQVNSPTNGSAVTAMQIVAAQAGSKRGVNKVELWLNNYKWTEAKGAPFLANGQTIPSDYVLRFPATVPAGVIDIVVKAYDDLHLGTTAPTITVTKGMPCSAATDCNKNGIQGQKCEAGKCFWDPPTGKLGDACDYAQFCETGICTPTNEGGFCSQDCVVGIDGACPNGFTCQPTGGANGQCIPEDPGGGCCSVGNDTGAVWMHFGVSALVLGFVVRRRRKR
jgi:MYXO-CTERM domain-containing protein